MNSRALGVIVVQDLLPIFLAGTLLLMCNGVSIGRLPYGPLTLMKHIGWVRAEVVLYPPRRHRVLAITGVYGVALALIMRVIDDFEFC